MTTNLTTIAENIRANLAEINSKTFETGALLLEAKKEFSKSSEFLEWSLESTGLKKSQTYKLMKIATTFYSEELMQGLSATVLYALTSASEEVLDGVKGAIKEGEVVTSEVLERIVEELEGVKPSNPPKEPKDPKDPKTPKTVEEKLQEKIDKAIDKAVKAATAAHERTKVKLEAVEAKADDLIIKNRELSKELKAAQKIISDLEKKPTPDAVAVKAAADKKKAAAAKRKATAAKKKAEKASESKPPF